MMIFKIQRADGVGFPSARCIFFVGTQKVLCADKKMKVGIPLKKARVKDPCYILFVCKNK